MSALLARPFLILCNAFVYAVLILPLIVVIVLAFSSGSGVDFPPPGYSLRWFQFIAGRPEFVSSFNNSLILAAVVAVLALGLGMLASLAIVRHRFPGRRIAETLFLAPLVMPSLIIGVALLQFLSLVGVMDSSQKLVLGHVILVLPYAIRSISACMYSLDPALEEASQVLGATPFKTFRRILLPLLRPGVVVAALFAFIISFGNLTISVFMIGARTVTLPVRIFNYLQYQFDPSIAAISTVMVAVTLLVLSIVQRTFGITQTTVSGT